MSTTTLPAKVSRITAQIARAEDVGELAELRDKIVALEALLEACGETVATVSQLTEARLEAERKAGQLLAEMRIHGRGRKAKGDSILDRLGVTRFHAMQWQTIGQIPQLEWHRWLAEKKADGRELSTTEAYRFARRFKPSKRKSPTRCPDITPAMAVEILARLFLDVKRRADGRPHTEVTSERILRAGEAIAALRCYIRGNGNGAG